MLWFSKKVTIYKKKSDKAAWTKIKDLLKEAGFRGVRAGHYSIESLYACGCGCKLDPRNFGANGFIDREIYFIDVREEDVTRAKDLISQNGIDLVIESDPWGKFGRV